MRECFIKVLAEFEKYINEHSYQKFIISEYEVVYLIENSCIEFIYYQKWDIFERIILEEIFNEGIYDLKLKKFQVLSCGIMLQFHPYYGGLGKDLSAIESSFPSCYSRVEQCLPELKIRERFEKWLGFKIPCIVFELSDFSKVGYAVYRTSAKHTINKVIDIGSTLYGTCICAKEQNFKHTDYGDYSEGGIEYYILFDRNMKEILELRAKSGSSSWRKENLYPSRLGIEEKGMRFCWLNAYIKFYEDYSDGKVIYDIKKGVYEDVDWYEYILPENKWKSEQLVYGLVKQLYPKEDVIYQHRPTFLCIGNRQLSYDIYIRKLRIAIEYQGKQHFEPVEIFGGSNAFKRQQERDDLKRKLSVANNVHLVYINYWEDITLELIEKKIKESLSSG